MKCAMVNIIIQRPGRNQAHRRTSRPREFHKRARKTAPGVGRERDYCTTQSSVPSGRPIRFQGRPAGIPVEFTIGCTEVSFPTPARPEGLWDRGSRRRTRLGHGAAPVQDALRVRSSVVRARTPEVGPVPRLLEAESGYDLRVDAKVVAYLLDGTA